jgi:hypothetical protein
MLLSAPKTLAVLIKQNNTENQTASDFTSSLSFLIWANALFSVRNLLISSSSSFSLSCTSLLGPLSVTTGKVEALLTWFSST